MLYFADFSVNDSQVYLVMDEDAFYKWNVTNENAENVKNWLGDREAYKFKLKYSNNYATVEITVYGGDACLLCEEIHSVDFI